MVFSVYYLIAAEQADEKVRKVRATMTVEHLRTAWNKAADSPYLATITKLVRPVKMRYAPRHLLIHRPKTSVYKEPISAWMYFDGPLSELRKQTNVVIDVPGGGFVAMTPRNHDDKLFAWAVDTKLPVLSIDYKKAPEYPYPYALNECFDVYQAIVSSYGQCLGFDGSTCPRITVTGDSAGGNLATAMTLMIISTNNAGGPAERDVIPLPAGLILLYPALDMNISSWMSEDQMALIKNDRVAKEEYSGFLRRKSEDLRRRYTPSTTPKPSTPDFNPFENGFLSATESAIVDEPSSPDIQDTQKAVEMSKPQMLRTRLAVSSVISYFGDRILTPEMMRAMIILYVGPYNRPDFKTDYLLSPAVAPDNLLSQFPKTYFMTGERDPLVDDTVIFAGRLRKAKEARFNERKEVGLEKSSAPFREKQHVEVILIPGISHGFIQFVSIFPEAWKHLWRCSLWIHEIFSSRPTSFEAPAIIAKRLHRTLPIQSNSSLELNGQRRLKQDDGGGQSGATTPTTSGDEDGPLMISSDATGNLTDNKSKEPRRRHKNDRAQRASKPHHHRQQQQPTEKSKGSFYKARSIDEAAQLGSEEDLLKRRMNELTMSMQGSDY
ncbi:putative lipase [Phaeomoniella chlamydospora]|uniref:Putative lipase n=1 Tax=Phaeomoniella chlamydospora TaxID=158046 RepID=A0A0G2H9G1_PHACM|nr:putative lipase [Phaeomoniella chlamydospora]